MRGPGAGFASFVVSTSAKGVDDVSTGITLSVR